ncbi:MAG: efflux RND transporter periplasmic adaptor subunit, partial [Geobacter sp.]
MTWFPRMVLLLLIAALLPVTGCGKSEKKGTATGGAQVIKGVTVEVVTAEVIPDLLEAVGTVRARNSASVAARVPGTVRGIHAREGDRVRKGQLLVTLESAESTAGAAGAKSAVVEADRGVDAAAARRKLAEATYERYQNLLAEQAVTRQEFEGRQMERDVAIQEFARAEARLAQAREVSRTAGTVAGYTRITSPLSGIVTARGVDAGMTVFPGMPVLTIEEEGGYRLEVAAPESIAGKVKPGNPVMVTMGGATAPTAGKISEVVPVVDPLSRTFIVKVDVVAAGI